MKLLMKAAFKTVGLLMMVLSGLVVLYGMWLSCVELFIVMCLLVTFIVGAILFFASDELHIHGGGGGLPPTWPELDP